MKFIRILIISILLFSFGRVKSQSYTKLIGDSINKWCFAFREDISLRYDYIQYQLLKKDTIKINGKIYSKLTQGLGSNRFTQGYIREDSIERKVYFIDIKYCHDPFCHFTNNKDDTSEYLLYDFDIATGDSVTVNDIVDSNKITVTAYIDTIKQSNGLREIYGIYKNDDGIINRFHWVEGVGSLYGIENNVRIDYPPFYNHNILLKCYSKDSSYSLCSCFEDYSGLRSPDIRQIKVYPNPTKNYLHFENTNNAKKIEVFDLNGKLIHSTNKTSIRTSQLNKGMYLYSVQLNNGKVVSGKFIKE